jgi:hypothetical protein
MAFDVSLQHSYCSYLYSEPNKIRSQNMGYKIPLQTLGTNLVAHQMQLVY